MISVLVVDDHPVVRKGIRSLLGAAGYTVVAETDDPDRVVTLYEEVRPEVVLVDIRLGERSGLEVLEALRAKHPDARVLMLSSFDDEEFVMRSLDLGARGYVLKGDSDTVLLSAVEAAAGGKHALSPQVTDRILGRLLDPPREPERFDPVDLRMLKLVCEGATNAEIGEELYMSDTTVKRRLRRIFAALGVTRRTEAAAEAARRGLV